MKIMKLELKHLAPYLPYGVKYYTDGLGTSRKIECKNAQHVIDNQELSKLILRPLSDLTREIDHNGKKQCVLDWWYDIEVSQRNDYEVLGKIPEYWKTVVDNIELNGFAHIDHGFMNILFEWHFDVFGLIPKGLAIDINTIDENNTNNN